MFPTLQGVGRIRGPGRLHLRRGEQGVTLIPGPPGEPEALLIAVGILD